MNIQFTVEEENLIAIYAEDSREQTINNILAAIPFMDSDIRPLADNTIRKLQRLGDSEFSELEFTLTDEE
ncbi:TPA: transposon-transfer assisting family protein [Clostridioides difficile]|nr:transposon-transfer assisting family protein [Clostridioides difficile]HEK8908299.1 transposon-transfer assisting family protein [Clostridioides difficile]